MDVPIPQYVGTLKQKYLGWRDQDTKQRFVEQYGAPEFEWTLRRYDGHPNGMAGKALQLMGKRIVFLNSARIAEMETKGVDGAIAHELGHIKNEHWLVRPFIYCVLLLTIVSLGSGAYFGNLRVATIFFLIFIGIFLLVAKWSRFSETRSDRFAVEFLGTDSPVISMLEGFQDGEVDDEGRIWRTIRKLSNTHPSPSDRINRIENRDGDEEEDGDDNDEY